jgi:hypothetical protein
MRLLKANELDNGTVVVNVDGDEGGYVMIEDVSWNNGWIQVTVFNDKGDVLLEQEFNTIAHPEIKDEEE